MGISNPTKRIRGPGLANMNFDTAVLFATECIKIGQRYDENPQLNIQNASEFSRDCAFGTVFASIAWLEAVINGVFLDAVECMPKDSRSRDSPKRASMHSVRSGTSRLKDRLPNFCEKMRSANCPRCSSSSIWR